MGAALGQRLQRLLVADKGGEARGQPGKQRVGGTVLGEGAIGGAHRLAMRALAHLAAQMLAQNADAVATAEKRRPRRDDFGHERQDLFLDPRLDGGFRLGRVADAAGTAADDHPGMIGEAQTPGQRLLIETDAARALGRKPALAQDRGEFVIGGLGFRAQLQDEKGLGHRRLRLLRYACPRPPPASSRTGPA